MCATSCVTSLPFRKSERGTCPFLPSLTLISTVRKLVLRTIRTVWQAVDAHPAVGALPICIFMGCTLSLRPTPVSHAFLVVH